MKQKDRIINDVKDILKFYDLGQFDEYGTIESIAHWVGEACHNCAYCDKSAGSDRSACNAPQGKTCHSGFRAFLDSEV